MNLSDVRKEYTKNGLYEEDLAPNPLDFFRQWLNNALELKIHEPTAMVVSTIGLDGNPSSRILLLKGLEESKLHFFTNYESQKAKELEKNPAVGLNFFWPEIERQVRIKGICAKSSLAKSKEYFHSRPRLSQIGAWASRQSQVVESREQLDSIFGELEQKWDGQEVPFPNNWGGYSVDPSEFEFWQGRENRLHDRLRYRKQDSSWIVERLNP